MSPKTARSTEGAGRKLVTVPTRVVVAVLTVLTLIFIFENNRQTRIRVIVPQITIPLWTALLGTFVVGALCGAYLFTRRRR
ncbi:DUF1049 domain-containing protein [Streptomyces sp. TP-A0874]|uniref:DUF1049 domain-containing protein n=1 Tax=Streptomyces sp. TP-A0874 TaxID=549819 RepID=UPI0008537EF1|nr:DUF1049 domain-containing protein [Streptomyces sp. TP-A0874]